MEPARYRSRWALDPERIDPDDYPPQQPFVRLLTWAFCSACGVQVHTSYTQRLLHGVVCPSCGARLLDPSDDPSEPLAEALRREDLFAAELEE